MHGTESITITTFWLDWLLLPIVLAGAWLTVRWARADSKQASNEAFLPAWAFSIPLFIAAAAWVIAGLGMLIREDYWEMKVIFGAFLLWTLCCLAGAILLLVGFLRQGKDFGAAGLLNLIGLMLMSLLMVLPGLIDHSSKATVAGCGHLWFILQAACVGLLLGGVLLGFPYKFPRFPLGLGTFFLVGWGLSEIALSQPSFLWLVRIWKLDLGLEYIDTFPASAGWQIAGLAKVLVGIGIAAVFIKVSRSRRHSPTI